MCQPYIESAITLSDNKNAQTMSLSDCYLELCRYDKNNMKTKIWTVLLTATTKNSITRLEATVRMGTTISTTAG